MKTYHVEIVKLVVNNGITTETSERLKIKASSPEQAHKLGQVQTKLKFMGDEMKVYVNGIESLLNC